MPVRTFSLTFTATMHIDQQVLDCVDDKWRAFFYDLDTPLDVVEHLAYNLIRGHRMSHLDGFAHLDDALVKMDDITVEYAAEDIPDKKS